MSETLPDLPTLLDNFDLIDDWEEKYRYLIELGHSLPPFPDAERNEGNKVRGCVSQVWLTTRAEPGPEGERLVFHGDSDAHIVRGLVALALAIFSGKTPQAILDADAAAIFARIGLAAHLTPQRSNGLQSMVQRIRAEARAHMAPDAPPSP